MKEKLFRRLGMLFLLLLGMAFCMQAQNVEQLKRSLSEATTTEQKAAINYDIAEALYSSNANEAMRYARRSYDLYIDIRRNSLAAQAAFLQGRLSEKLRNTNNAKVWYESAFDLSKRSGDADLILRSVQKRSQIAERERKYRDAYNIVGEALTYFSKDGRSMAELERSYQRQKDQLERERKALMRDKEILEAQINRLNSERNVIVSQRDQLSERQEQLLTEKEEVEKEIGEREVALDSIKRIKNQAEQVAEARGEEVKQLSREKLEQEVIISEERAAAAEAKIALDHKKSEQLILTVAAGAGAILAGLLLLLFLSTRRSQRSLKEKNNIIETERERSDELLLNILPAPIAEELKTTGKAKAKRYDQVTVLFTDFKDFTTIAEKMPPEQLVEELDTCFKAFDFIISQHDDIEKIKTIGDAYMCVSGLNERRTVPKNIVSAALEMQAFLEDHKQENIRKGIPYFEARLGIHTGPVVAGVVGVKKFAYDIWGDAVNIASRVESNGQVGKISVSEHTYQLIRYHFDCRYHARINAKNKGPLDIYHVASKKVAVTV